MYSRRGREVNWSLFISEIAGRDERRIDHGRIEERSERHNSVTTNRESNTLLNISRLNCTCWMKLLGISRASGPSQRYHGI